MSAIVDIIGREIRVRPRDPAKRLSFAMGIKNVI